MEELARESKETLKRIERNQQLLDALCAREDVDASMQQEVEIEFCSPPTEEATTTPQPYDFTYPTFNKEIITLDDPYEEQLEVESYEDHGFHYTTELEACGDSDMDEPFWDEEFFINKESDIELNENEFQEPEATLIPPEEAMRDLFEEESIIIPIAEPLSTPHERPPDVSLQISSPIHIPSIKEALEFEKEPHEYSCFQDHVEMVISEYHKPSVEIFFTLHIELPKRRWRWRKGKMKTSLESYLSMATKGPKLLSRAHAASLMQAKHLMAPRPKPPDYS